MKNILKPFNYVVLISERKGNTTRMLEVNKRLWSIWKSHNVRHSYQKIGQKINIIPLRDVTVSFIRTIAKVATIQKCEHSKSSL